MHPTLSLIPPLLMACQGWPTHSDVDPSTRDAFEAGADPRLDVEMAWLSLSEEGNNDLTPAAMHGLLAGQGMSFSGRLEGWGWNPNAQAERPGDCGEWSAFPPQDLGDYVGDVDWFGVYMVQQDTTLCASLQLQPDPLAEVESLSFDLVGFHLDPCGIPVEPFEDADGEPVGWGQGGTEAEWSRKVSNGDTVGIALAGYHPNDSALVIDYQLGISLVPSNNTGPGLCPRLPEK